LTVITLVLILFCSNETELVTGPLTMYFFQLLQQGGGGGGSPYVSGAITIKMQQVQKKNKQNNELPI